MKIPAQTYIQVPDHIQRLINLAVWDLWYGPITEPDDGEPWPGFQVACETISEWAQEHMPSVLYYYPDWDGWVETLDEDEDWWPYYALDWKEALLGGGRMNRALAEYLA